MAFGGLQIVVHDEVGKGCRSSPVSTGWSWCRNGVAFTGSQVVAHGVGGLDRKCVQVFVVSDVYRLELVEG